MIRQLNTIQMSDSVSKNAVVITSLRTEINTLNTRLIVADANLADSHQQLSASQAELAASQEQIANKSLQIEEAVYEINRLKARLDFLENETIYLKTKANKSLTSVLNGGATTPGSTAPPPPATPLGTPVKEVFPPFCCCVM